uniref:C2 domain-containing protein n=1 Tax=Heterorhabditis bacteriophora TaxID=37862 RepID=A0A1I7W9R6_HETBA
MVKSSSEPQYDHSASIQLHRPDLDVCTVRIEVWSLVGVLRRKQQLGWIALGLNSSSPDAQEHWQQMIQIRHLVELKTIDLYEFSFVTYSIFKCII